jgi:histidine triad (HIT) family protein
MCIFCKILNKELPADIIYEDEKILAFKDIHPKAPIHILIIPKDHIISVDHLKEENKELIGELVLVAKKIAEMKGLSTGYKLTINVGKDGGQEVDHLHLHLLGGKK